MPCMVLTIVNTVPHVAHRSHLPVPMSFRIFVQGRKHDRQYHLDIVANQIAKVFVVPEVECAFGDLYAYQRRVDE